MNIPKIDPRIAISATVLSLFAVLGGFISTIEIAKLPFMLLFCIIYGIFSLVLVKFMSPTI